MGSSGRRLSKPSLSSQSEEPVSTSARSTTWTCATRIPTRCCSCLHVPFSNQRYDARTVWCTGRREDATGKDKAAVRPADAPWTAVYRFGLHGPRAKASGYDMLSREEGMFTYWCIDACAVAAGNGTAERTWRSHRGAPPFTEGSFRGSAGGSSDSSAPPQNSTT